MTFMQRTMIATSVFALFLAVSGPAAAEQMVADGHRPGDFALVRAGGAADILYDPSDYKVVAIAAGDLAGDVERVTGVKPALKTEAAGLSSYTVIVGTIERCGPIRELIARGKLDLDAIEGQWETFTLATV